MPYPKQHYLDKRVPDAFSIRRRTKFALEEKCKELGLSKSAIVEELINNFLTNN